MFKSERIELFRKLYPFIKKDRKRYIALGGLKVYTLALTLITPLFYMLLINDVMIKRRLAVLAVVVAGYVGVYALQSLGVVLNKRVYNSLFLKMNLGLKTKLLSDYASMKTADYNRYDIGDLKNRIENDMTMIEKFLSAHCLDYLYALASVLVIGVILLCFNWMLALFGFVMVPLSFLFVKVMGKKSGRAWNDYREHYGRYEGFLHSALQNWKEIKTNNLEKREEQILTTHWDKLTKLFVKNQVYWYINRTFIAFKDFFITQMNLYFIGGLLIINGKMTVAVLLVFMNYYSQFFTNISSMTDLIIGLKNDRASISRIIEIISYPCAKKAEIQIQNDELKISHLNFGYNGDKTVLSDINLEIGEKEHVAIAGRSGCGKTTLAKLLLGIYEPDAGAIFIGGYNIKNISRKSLSRKIGIVMQDPMLFNLTIRENLMLAKKRAGEAELISACKKADIYDFIRQLPDGFDTVIGERGVKLSGGQKQRLAIARTILLSPDIIVFDEATSSLDNESEKAILNSITDLSQSKTIITIAHRLSSVIGSVRVIVIDGGKIAASGHHTELHGNNELYDILFASQYEI